jgi:Iron-containing redox enzyme
MTTTTTRARSKPVRLPAAVTDTGSAAALLERVLAGGEGGAEAVPERVGRRDRVCTLAAIYALHLGEHHDAAALRRSMLAGHPTVAALKWSLEQSWLAELEPLPAAATFTDPAAVARELRALAAADRLPPVYRWLARTADREALVEFLSLEGGPDAGFDDLVADCQVGLTGRPKGELAQNYWDEMGNGDPDAVHTVLHERLVAALGIRRIPDEELPVEALERTTLGGLLATNHALQPEMVGALGLIELQAGPRCRLVLQALDRLDCPAAAVPFYAVHAEVDPRHGKDWLDNAVEPLVAERPEWGPRIVRGARWRSQVNAAFFAWAAIRFCGTAAGEVLAA